MDFEVGRLRGGSRIAGGSAVVLFILIFFLKWFGISIDGFSGNINGWQALKVIRWLELLLIVGALGMVYLEGTTAKLEAPVSLSVLVTGLGALVTALLLYRVLIVHPHQSHLVVLNKAAQGTASDAPKLAAFLAVLAAAAVTYGGYSEMREEQTSRHESRDTEPPQQP
jgi:hypothetical protein